jgi:hypothetical protein
MAAFVFGWWDRSLLSRLGSFFDLVASDSLAPLGSHERVEPLRRWFPAARTSRANNVVEVSRRYHWQFASVLEHAKVLFALPKQFLVTRCDRREQGIDGMEDFIVRAHLGWRCPPDESENEERRETNHAHPDDDTPLDRTALVCHQ